MLLPIETAAGPRALRTNARAVGDVRAWRSDLRRGLNIVLAVIALVVTLPLMFVIGIMIKMTTPGPILYTQPRVGVDRRNQNGVAGSTRRVVDHGGRLFRIYKFRTMYTVPDGASQRWAQPDDPRVTVVGRVLRKYRLDELPQLFNVLRGDMNLVGPRPEQPRIFAELRERIPEYRTRQRVLPGITGWAQVNQTYDRTTDDVRRKVQYDLEYIRRESPLEDVKILAYTLPAVLLNRRGW